MGVEPTWTGATDRCFHHFSLMLKRATGLEPANLLVGNQTRHHCATPAKSTA